MTTKLEDMGVAILVAEGFEQAELVEPRRALDERGATTAIVSSSKGRVNAWRHRDWGWEFPVDVHLPDARPEDYQALVVPGGVLGCDRLRADEDALRFVRHFFHTNKPVAAICHGPWILIDAEGVRGRKLTSHPSIQADLKNAGAEWFDAEVVVDGNLVTSRRPDDLPAFVSKFIEVLAEAKNTVRH